MHTYNPPGRNAISANLPFASRPKDGAAWSDLYLSTCLTWVTLPGVLHPASIAIKVIEVLKPHTRVILSVARTDTTNIPFIADDKDEDRVI